MLLDCQLGKGEMISAGVPPINVLLIGKIFEIAGCAGDKDWNKIRTYARSKTQKLRGDVARYKST